MGCIPPAPAKARIKIGRFRQFMRIGKASALSCLAIGALMLPSACSFGTVPYIYNNFGGVISIQYHPASDRPDETVSKKIKPGKGQSFHLIGAFGDGWIRISTENCVADYQIPSVDTSDYLSEDQRKNFPKYRFIRTQIEPDFRIYLAPPDAKSISDANKLAATQLKPFPITPSTLACDGETDEKAEIETYTAHRDERS